MTDQQPPLDSRLLNAMKRLRLENIHLQKHLRTLQGDFSQAHAHLSQSTLRTRELEAQLHMAQRRVESLETTQAQWETQRAAVTQLVQRQAQELQELRTLARQQQEEIERQQQCITAGEEELERVKAQARQVIVQHYQGMKTAQEQAQVAFEEARRAKAQLEAIRAPMSPGRRKVLPPRSLRPTPSGNSGVKPS